MPSMKAGDHLVTPRAGYTHHGLYIGNDDVIHYSGFSDNSPRGPIEITTLDNFSKGQMVSVDTHSVRTYNHEESVKRAFSRLGENEYDVIFNNCEHFVYWCIKGFSYSSQIEGRILAYMAYRATMPKITEKLIAQYLLKYPISQELQSAMLRSATVASTAAPSIMSSSVGTVVGIATSTSIASSTGVVAATLAAGLTATSVAPIAAVAAVSVGAGYCAKKVIDWLWD